MSPSVCPDAKATARWPATHATRRPSRRTGPASSSRMLGPGGAIPPTCPPRAAAAAGRARVTGGWFADVGAGERGEGRPAMAGAGGRAAGVGGAAPSREAQAPGARARASVLSEMVGSTLAAGWPAVYGGGRIGTSVPAGGMGGVGGRLSRPKPRKPVT